MDARVLIMDEPTSAVADAEVQRLFGVICSLTADGVAIVYISHRIEELEAIAGSVSVLRDGSWIGAEPMAGTSRNELITMMVGRSVDELPQQRPRVGDEEPVRLQVRGASAWPPTLGWPRRRDPHEPRCPSGRGGGSGGSHGRRTHRDARGHFGAYSRHEVSGTMLLDGRPYRPRSPGPRSTPGSSWSLRTASSRVSSLGSRSGSTPVWPHWVTSTLRLGPRQGRTRPGQRAGPPAGGQDATTVSTLSEGTSRR